MTGPTTSPVRPQGLKEGPRQIDGAAARVERFQQVGGVGEGRKIGQRLPACPSPAEHTSIHKCDALLILLVIGFSFRFLTPGFVWSPPRIVSPAPGAGRGGGHRAVVP